MKDKNSGYIGNRMSKNAYRAHQNGEFPISKIDANLLRKHKFKYSVAFFRWFCPNINQIQILQEWSEEPSNGYWKNDNKDAIVRKIILFKDMKDILNK